MSNFPSLTPKERIKVLEGNGSHHYYVHPVTGKITVVPPHNKDLAKGTLHVILKQSGIEKEDI